jgi:hypothetical protein
MSLVNIEEARLQIFGELPCVFVGLDLVHLLYFLLLCCERDLVVVESLLQGFKFLGLEFVLGYLPIIRVQLLFFVLRPCSVLSQDIRLHISQQVCTAVTISTFIIILFYFFPTFSRFLLGYFLHLFIFLLRRMLLEGLRSLHLVCKRCLCTSFGSHWSELIGCRSLQ